jgi:hypothetical protein
LDQSLELANRVESRLNTLLDQPDKETAASTSRRKAAVKEKG